MAGMTPDGNGRGRISAEGTSNRGFRPVASLGVLDMHNPCLVQGMKVGELRLSHLVDFPAVCLYLH